MCVPITEKKKKPKQINCLMDFRYLERSHKNLFIKVKNNSTENSSLHGLDTHARTDFSMKRDLRSTAMLREIKVVIIV